MLQGSVRGLGYVRMPREIGARGPFPDTNTHSCTHTKLITNRGFAVSPSPAQTGTR